MADTKKDAPESAPKSESKTQDATPPQARGVGPVGDAKVIKADEAPSAKAAESDLVTIEEDVYEEFYFPGTKRPAYRLLYRAGQTVSRRELDNRTNPVELKADTSLNAEIRAEGSKS